jgi:hypothetical protein
MATKSREDRRRSSSVLKNTEKKNSYGIQRVRNEPPSVDYNASSAGENTQPYQAMQDRSYSPRVATSVGGAVPSAPEQPQQPTQQQKKSAPVESDSSLFHKGYSQSQIPSSTTTTLVGQGNPGHLQGVFPSRKEPSPSEKRSR